MEYGVKRSYIRRKKCITNCYEKIKNTLDLIKANGKLDICNSDIQKLAMYHAKSIDAACWSPSLRMKPLEFEILASAKTNQLAMALAKKYMGPLFFHNQSLSLALQSVNSENRVESAKETKIKDEDPESKEFANYIVEKYGFADNKIITEEESGNNELNQTGSYDAMTLDQSKIINDRVEDIFNLDIGTL